MPQKNNLIISNTEFTIEISEHSGFCFGVVNAIEEAEKLLESGEDLYCVGSIVHNKQEVNRLHKKGLKIINHEQLKKLKNKKILFRAHGEPPESYKLAKTNGHRLTDATCPVVLNLQQKVKKAYNELLQINGQVVIFGKKNHAEVIGLLGQTDFNAIVIEDINDIHKVDLNRPIELFSQTTKPLDLFYEIVDYFKKNAKSKFNFNDTVCRQVSNRQNQLYDFSKRFETVYFVGDPQSSNSKLLYSICKKANPQSYFITNPDDIDKSTFIDKKTIGICGATSTPAWLMQDIAKFIETEKSTIKH
jgi:4-hydroxy-3-methylbut-2-enyl diphosphate reductase